METISATPSGMVRKRSTFLTIICVLTFIGSGWGILRGIRSYVEADSISINALEHMEKLEDRLDSYGAPDFLKHLASAIAYNMTPGNVRKFGIFSLIGNLLTITGALMMWNLNKTGFYIYLLGWAIIILIPVIILGKPISITAMIIRIAFSGVFITMYAMNLKQIKS